MRLAFHVSLRYRGALGSLPGVGVVTPTRHPQHRYPCWIPGPFLSDPVWNRGGQSLKDDQLGRRRRSSFSRSFLRGYYIRCRPSDGPTSRPIFYLAFPFPLHLNPLNGLQCISRSGLTVLSLGHLGSTPLLGFPFSLLARYPGPS